MDASENTSDGSAKADDALRTIGEACDELGTKPHILRYWEDRFDRLRPLKRAGGRRYYRPADMELLRTIKRLLVEEGYTIEGARKYLAANKRSATTGSAKPAEGDTAERAASTASSGNREALRRIRDRLEKAIDS